MPDGTRSSEPRCFAAPVDEIRQCWNRQNACVAAWPGLDNPVVAGNEHTFQSCGDQVGLLDEEIQARVRSFEVIAL